MLQDLVKALSGQYQLRFQAGRTFSWSAENKIISYPKKTVDGHLPVWSLLHEAGHALLDHKTYKSDFELLLLEAAAWRRAKRLGREFNTEIDENHIQDCLDTYRDWLHKRSACPRCGVRGLQSSPKTYNCFNCGQLWQVTAARFCRPSRQVQIKLKTPA